MHTYGNLEYNKDEIDVEEASTSSYIHPYAYRATVDTSLSSERGIQEKIIKVKSVTCVQLIEGLNPC